METYNPLTHAGHRSRFSAIAGAFWSIHELTGRAISFIIQSDPGLEDFNPTYRWLPIVSGLLVPFAILLEIPGLTEHWYIRRDYTTRTDREYRPNPTVLNVGLGISIASAIVANIALVIRFLERHIKAMTLIAMTALTLHDIINITAIISFGFHGRKNDGFTFAQAYWMTCCSTVISTVTNVTLIVDYVRTDRFSQSGSGLTSKQRSLVIIVIILFSWIAAGAGVFSAMMDLSFQDALYFTIVSIETIGFGDITPRTTNARVFTFFYTTIGILNLALAVTTISGTITESFQHSHRLRRRQAAKRRAETEQTQRHSRHVEGKELAYQHNLPVPETEQHLLFPEALSPELDAQLKKEVQDEQRTEFVYKLFLAWGAFTVFWVAGSIIFMHTENWSFGTALYFCYTAWSTVGYGDLSPKSNPGRAIFLVWALLGVGSLTILISVISEAYATRYQTVVHGKFDHYLRYRMKLKQDARIQEREHDRAGNAPIKRTDTLSADLIQHARTYHPHMRQFLGLNIGHDDNISPELQELLMNEMTDEDNVTKNAILKNAELRKTLFIISYDKSLDRLIQAALAAAEEAGLEIESPASPSASSNTRPTSSSSTAGPAVDPSDLRNTHHRFFRNGRSLFWPDASKSRRRTGDGSGEDHQYTDTELGMSMEKG